LSNFFLAERPVIAHPLFMHPCAVPFPSNLASHDLMLAEMWW